MTCTNAKCIADLKQARADVEKWKKIALTGKNEDMTSYYFCRLCTDEVKFKALQRAEIHLACKHNQHFDLPPMGYEGFTVTKAEQKHAGYRSKWKKVNFKSFISGILYHDYHDILIINILVGKHEPIEIQQEEKEPEENTKVDDSKKTPMKRKMVQSETPG